MTFFCPVFPRKKFNDDYEDTSFQYQSHVLKGSKSLTALHADAKDDLDPLKPYTRIFVTGDFVPSVDDELVVKKSDLVTGLFREQDWIYVKNDEGQEGFIPVAVCVPFGAEDLATGRNRLRSQNGTETLKKSSGSLSPSKALPIDPQTSSRAQVPAASILRSFTSFFQTHNSKSQQDLSAMVGQSFAGDLENSSVDSLTLRNRKHQSASAGSPSTIKHCRSVLTPRKDLPPLPTLAEINSSETRSFSSLKPALGSGGTPSQYSPSSRSSLTPRALSPLHSSAALHSIDRRLQKGTNMDSIRVRGGLELRVSDFSKQRTGSFSSGYSLTQSRPQRLAHNSSTSSLSNQSQAENWNRLPFTPGVQSECSTPSVPLSAASFRSFFAEDLPKLSELAKATCNVEAHQPTVLPFEKRPLGRFVAACDFVPQYEQDIGVSQGQVFLALNCDDPDWTWVVVESGAEGFVPSNRILPFGDSEEPLPQSVDLRVQNHQVQAVSTGSSCSAQPEQQTELISNRISVDSSSSYLAPGSINAGGAVQNPAYFLTSIGAAANQLAFPPVPTIASNAMSELDNKRGAVELVVTKNYLCSARDHLPVRRGESVYISASEFPRKLSTASFSNSSSEAASRNFYSQRHTNHWLWVYSQRLNKHGHVPAAYVKLASEN